MKRWDAFKRRAETLFMVFLALVVWYCFWHVVHMSAIGGK